MKGIYAGSFDPPTNGHLWMIEQGAKLFCKFYVAIGQNSQKAYTFTLDERVEMLQEMCADFDNVEVVQFENKFLVKYAESIGVDYILRGIRNEKDYTYERGMRYVNSNMNNTIQTLLGAMVPAQAEANGRNTVHGGAEVPRVGRVVPGSWPDRGDHR